MYKSYTAVISPACCLINSTVLTILSVLASFVACLFTLSISFVDLSIHFTTNSFAKLSGEPKSPALILLFTVAFNCCKKSLPTKSLPFSNQLNTSLPIFLVYESAAAIADSTSFDSSAVIVTVPDTSLMFASVCHTPALLPGPNLEESNPNFACVSAKFGPPTYSVCQTMPTSALNISFASSLSLGTAYASVLGLKYMYCSPSCSISLMSFLRNIKSPCATVSQFSLLKCLKHNFNLSRNPLPS